MDSNCVKIVLQENIAKIGKPDLSMFAKNIRRAEEYDNEECPERWKPAVAFVKQNGWNTCPDNTIELLKRFGERVYAGSMNNIESSIAIYNFAARNGARCVFRAEDLGKDNYSKDPKPAFWIPLHHRSVDSAEIDELQRKRQYECSYYDGKCKEVVLEDRIAGCCLTFLEYKGRQLKAPFSGIPDVPAPGVAADAFHLGEISIEDLAVVGQRRFMYVFGCTPAEKHDVINALVLLNNLPQPGRFGGEEISYKLEERQLAQLPHSDGIKLIFDEAREAKARGLFADAKVYELVGTKRRVPDPVIIGIDHFGHQYPVVYWSGDKGIVEEKK